MYEKVEGGGGKRVHLGFLEMFFSLWSLGFREGFTGGFFFTNSLWDGGKGAPGERVQV
jgi:hypothetical protein